MKFRLLSITLAVAAVLSASPSGQAQQDIEQTDRMITTSAVQTSNAQATLTPAYYYYHHHHRHHHHHDRHWDDGFPYWW